MYYRSKIMMWIYVYSQLFLLFMPDQTLSCELPSYMNGSWSDGKFINVEFSYGTTMYLPEYSISRKGSTTNLSCYINEGDIYVLRTTESINITASDTTQLYYYYLCMDITQITDYSFYYYLQTDTDTNGERTTAFDADLTFDSITPFCGNTLDLKLFSVMVRNGFEKNALQTCSTPLLGAFAFELENSVGTTCISTGMWSFTDDIFTTLNISYTTGENCDTKIGLSENSNVGCLMCIQSDTTYYTALVNLDTSDINGFSSKFTCMVSNNVGTNVTFTQRGRLCDEQQTASILPSTTSLHPSKTAVIGALVYLVPTGQETSMVADCFPRSTTTNTAQDDSSSNIILIVVVVVCLIVVLILLLVIAAIIYRCKLTDKNENENNDKVPKRRSRFLVTLRTAFLAGMGDKREKALITRTGSTIEVENTKDKQPTSAENKSNIQDVRIETPTVKTQDISKNVPEQNNTFPVVTQNDTSFKCTKQEKDTYESARTENNGKFTGISPAQKESQAILQKSKVTGQLLSEEKQIRQTGSNFVLADIEAKQLSTTEHNIPKRINKQESHVKVQKDEDILNQRQTATMVTKPNGNFSCSNQENVNIEKEIKQQESPHMTKEHNKSTETTIQLNKPVQEPVTRTSGLSIVTMSTSIESFSSDTKDFMQYSEFRNTDEISIDKHDLTQFDANHVTVVPDSMASDANHVTVVPGYNELMTDKKRMMFIASSSTDTKTLPEELNLTITKDADNSASHTKPDKQSCHGDGTGIQITLPNEVQNTDTKEKCESSDSFHETVTNIHNELDNDTSPNQLGITWETGQQHDYQPIITGKAGHNKGHQPHIPRDADHNNDNYPFKTRDDHENNRVILEDANDYRINPVKPVHIFSVEKLLPGQIMSSAGTRSEVPSQSKPSGKLSAAPSSTLLQTEPSETMSIGKSLQLKTGTNNKESDANIMTNAKEYPAYKIPKEYIVPTDSTDVEMYKVTSNDDCIANSDLLQSNDDVEVKPSKHDRSQLYREQTRIKLYHAPENVFKIQYERRYKTTVSLKDLMDQRKKEVRQQVKKTKSPYHSKVTIDV